MLESSAGDRGIETSFLVDYIYMSSRVPLHIPPVVFEVGLADVERLCYSDFCTSCTINIMLRQAQHGQQA